MTQFYSDPERERDPYALPDCEVFYLDTDKNGDDILDSAGNPISAGWYWQACFPGCLPDGDPIGPFDTEREAIADAQDL